jgi:hypothetical protein
VPLAGDGSTVRRLTGATYPNKRQASALLDAKASGDAVAYKTWLGKISQGVAEAAKEGGFLGIGGVPVSDAEKATLAEISSALKI